MDFGAWGGGGQWRTYVGAREGPGPLKFAALIVNIICFKGNLVEVTNKSPIRPSQNKFGPTKKKCSSSAGGGGGGYGTILARGQLVST